MTTDYSTHFNFAILVQCAFGILYLSTYNWRTNRWLVLFLVGPFLLHLGTLFGPESLSLVDKLYMGNPGFVLVSSPALYLFTRELVANSNSKVSNWLHFLPAFLFYVLCLFFDLAHPRAFAELIKTKEVPLIQVVHIVVAAIQTIYYGASTLRLIAYNQKKHRQEYAESNIFITLAWLKYTVWMFMSLSIVGILAIPLYRFIDTAFFPFELTEVAFLLAALVFCFFAFRQPLLYGDVATVPIIQEEGIPISSKPLLDKGAVVKLEKRIEGYFKEEQPFLIRTIRMPEVARRLGVTANEFSWYLNERLDKNFFTFINQYRVQHAVALMREETYDHYTLEAVGNAAGFRSRTTFIQRFKEEMGQTPSAYRKYILDMGGAAGAKKG